MKFLANENIPAATIERLREIERDVHSIAESDPGSTDREVLQKAVDEDRIVLTFDRDYGELVFRRDLPRPPGVVYFRFTPKSPEEPAKLMGSLLEDDEIELDGMFTVLRRTDVRQRPLNA